LFKLKDTWYSDCLIIKYLINLFWCFQFSILIFDIIFQFLFYVFQFLIPINLYMNCNKDWIQLEYDSSKNRFRLNFILQNLMNISLFNFMKVIINWVMMKMCLVIHSMILRWISLWKVLMWNLWKTKSLMK